MAKHDQGDGASSSLSLESQGGVSNPTTALIDRLVAHRVIPTLVQSHHGNGPKEPDSSASLALAQLAAAADETALHTALEDALTQGLGAEPLLTAVARALGTLWEEDALNFSEVTMATARLQRWHRGQSDRIFSSGRDQPAHRILLATVPGEQHSLGLSLASSAFHEAGWAVEGGPGLSAAQLRAQVRMHWFDVLGLSLSSERALSPIAELVRDLRAQSKNSQLLVVVGGPLVAQRKDIIDALGVDDAFSSAQGVPEALAKSLPKP